MHRFFLPPGLFNASEIIFPVETARQIRAVLRLRPGERVLALDDRGSEYELALTRVDAAQVAAQVIEKRDARGEPRVRLTLYLGLTQREKFEWILQKCTEVGAAGFVPFISSRALVQDSKDSAKKQERWQRILREAAEQSGRGRIPALHPAITYAEALRLARKSSVPALLAWEGEMQRSLRTALSALHPPVQIGLFIGPEGGFSEEEAALADEMGVVSFSLGRRILRMETAAVAATALLLNELGEMG